MTITLEGVAWGHTRGYLPMVATAQRFEEVHPDVRILWHRRSLHDFGHADVADLADRFDLVVVDHPWMGFGAARRCFLPVEPYVDPDDVDDWRRHALGASFDSYVWDDVMLAAPIDAAAPVAFVALERGAPVVEPPATWEEMLCLARGDRVAAPCFAPDLLLHLFMLLRTSAADLLVAADAFAPRDAALDAMDRLRTLVDLLPTWCDDASPIAIHEAIARGDADYCPFAYAYGNYAREGYAARRLRFLDLPSLDDGTALSSVLGGTGLAVSARCAHPEVAFAYLSYVASAKAQAGIYAFSGGQPAHALAWQSRGLDDHAGGFFSATRATIERAWVRPRFYGYPLFQEQAGRPLQRWVRGRSNATDTLAEMNRIYRASHELKSPHPIPRVDTALDA